MISKLVKIEHLWIEILDYMNVCEWIQKMITYLKNKNFWISIETVLEEHQIQKSDKTSESASTEIIKASKKTDDATIDSMIEKSILTH